MTPSLYQLLSALTLLGLCIAVLIYRFFRKEARPEILRAMWVVSGIGAAAFMFSMLFASADRPDWLQGWVYTFRAVPYHAACSVIALLVVRSVGNKYPRLLPWLKAAPWVFGAAVASALVFSIFNPVPALDEYEPVSQGLLLLKIRSVPELLYPILTGVVFATEMLRRQTPSAILRLQYFFLSLASACFAGLILVAGYGTYLRINETPTAAELPALEWQLSLQVSLMALGCLGYFLGVALYHSDEERERIVRQFEDWIRFRHDLELAFDQNFGDGLVLGKGLGNSAADERYYMSITQLNQKLIDDNGYSRHDEDRGEKLFLLLGLLTVSEERYSLAKSLHEAQDNIIRNSDLASRIFVHMDRNFRYDIRADAVFQAIAPALAIANAHADYLPLEKQAKWIQLAVLMASEIGFIPAKARGTDYETASRNVSSPVLRAYAASRRS